MKALKILGHPVVVISLFLFTMIEGEHFGGFYVLYLFFGLTYFAPFALLATAGIATVVIGYNLKNKKHYLQPILHLFGWSLLLLSFFVFFQDGKSNNKETFETTVPVLTFVLFGLSSICFLINLTQSFIHVRRNQNRLDVV